MRYQILATALAAQVTLSAAMPQPDQTVYETEIDTITSCGPEVTNCPARSTQPGYAAPSEPAVATSVPAYAPPAGPASSGPAPSAPASSGPVPSAPAPSAPASSGVDGSHPDGPKTIYTTDVQTITSCGADVTNCPARSTHPATATGSVPSGTPGKTCEEQENMCRTKPGANMAQCSADRAACDGYIPGQPSGTGSAPVPSGTSGTQTCEEQENMCRTKPGANMAQCSADRAACDGYIPGQPSGTGSAPVPSGTSGTQTCEQQENMCRTKPGANMAQCSADRAACDGYIPGQPSGGSPPSNATASLGIPTPTPAQPTPAQWTGAASTSFISFGVMALGAAAAAFVM